MKPDFDSSIPEQGVRFHGISNRASPLIQLKNPVVQMLNSEFDLGNPKFKHPVNMFSTAPVRPGLKRDSHTPDLCFLVSCKDGITLTGVEGNSFTHRSLFDLSRQSGGRGVIRSKT